MSLKPEAEKVFSELSVHNRFYKGFREAEIWVYKQREKRVSTFALKHYIKEQCIKRLLDEGVLETEGKWYTPNNVSKLFNYIIEEEKELVEKLSNLCFGEPETSYTEALEIVLLNLEDLGEYRKRKAEVEKGVLNQLERFNVKEDKFTNNIMIQILEVSNNYLNYLKREIEKNFTTYY